METNNKFLAVKNSLINFLIVQTCFINDYTHFANEIKNANNYFELFEPIFEDLISSFYYESFNEFTTKEQINTFFDLIDNELFINTLEQSKYFADFRNCVYYCFIMKIAEKEQINYESINVYNYFIYKMNKIYKSFNNYSFNYLNIDLNKLNDYEVKEIFNCYSKYVEQ